MGFNTAPLAGPASVQSGASPSNAQMDARSRAIAKLMGGATSQPTPVPNPTSISPEEASAVTSQVQSSEPTGQSVSNEPATPADPKEATAPKEEALSSQYAQLARKEKQIRAQVNAVKAQEAAIKAREDALKAREAEYQSNYVSKDTIAKDPMKVLLDQGYTQEQITNMLLNAPDPATQQRDAVIDELRSEIKALKDGQETVKKTFADNQTQSYNQAVNQIRNDVKQLAYSGDTYEMIKATNSTEDVVELIQKTFESDGTLLTVEEASQAVEDYLVDEALKVAKLNKIQQRLKPAAAPAAASQQTQSAPKQPAKTLTNSMGTSRPLSAKERAVLAFKGELK